MKEKIRRLSNLLLFVVTTMALSVLQTTLWFQFLGPFPPPLFWLPPIVYLSLYRHPQEGIWVIYLCLAAIINQTALALGINMLLGLLLSIMIVTFKTRVFFSGPRYFSLVTSAAAFVIPPLQWALSTIFEAQPLLKPDWQAWFISPLLTYFVSTPLYPFLVFIDRITDKEQLVETRKEQIL